MNGRNKNIAISFILSLSGLLLCLILQACDEGHRTYDPPETPRFVSDITLGEITVFNDVHYATDDASLYRVVAVGYRDSLGGGVTEPLFVVMDRWGQFLDTSIISSQGLSALSVVTYDRYTHMFISAGEGASDSQNFFRIDVRDSSYKSFNIPYLGSVVHPTEIVSSESGEIAISGWIEDGGIEKGFIVALDSDNTVRWSRYYSASGKNIRCVNMVKDDAGYVLAITESSEGSPSLFERSYLQTVALSGSDREKIEIAVSDFRIRDLVWNKDTGYSVVGEIMREPRTGYIGLLNDSGVELWKAPLGTDSLFIPIAIDGEERHVRNAIIGNEGNSGLSYSMDELLGRMFFDGPWNHPFTRYLSLQRVHDVDGSSAWIIGAITDYSYDGSGNLTKAKAVVIR